MLTAQQVQKGWMLYYSVPRCAQCNSFVKEDLRKRRKTRILFPLMRRMNADIGANRPVEDCGWLDVKEIEPSRAKRARDRLRKDRSDLNKDLLPLGLNVESALDRMRLSASLASARCICRTPDE